MRLDTTMTQRMDQKMMLAPRMIPSMEILQLPIMALQERIQQELQENPVLELKQGAEDEQTTEEQASSAAAGEEGDKKHDPMRNGLSRPQSLLDYLNAQLAFLDCTPEQLRLLRYLITHISENGYLTVSTEEIAKSYDQPVSVVQ